MKKDIIKTMAVACALTALTSITAFAAEDIKWITGEPYGDNANEWQIREGVAQCQKWVEEHKGDIASIQDEVARYDAVVKTVTDFLTYDVAYKQPAIAYTIRDGKGVCTDYTALTHYLCDAVGIENTHWVGNAFGDLHDCNKVKLNGVWYYSDVTSVEAGLPEYKLSTTLWSSHTTSADGETGDASFIGMTGLDTGEWTQDVLDASNAGMEYCKDWVTGKVFWITPEDAKDLDEGRVTVEYILQKYNVR